MPPTTRRGIARAGVAFSLVGPAALVAACGVQSGGETTTGAQTSKAPAPVLHWFGYAPPHRFGLGQQAVLDDFQARNPGRVALEVGESGGNVGLAKIKTAVAAGTQPALWFGWQVEASDLHGLGSVVDLNAELKGNKEWVKNKADLIPTLVAGAQWKGQLTLVPMIADPNVLGFNKKLLAQSGAAPPRPGYTWDDWLEIGKRAAAPRTASWGSSSITGAPCSGGVSPTARCPSTPTAPKPSTTPRRCWPPWSGCTST